MKPDSSDREHPDLMLTNPCDAALLLSPESELSTVHTWGVAADLEVAADCKQRKRWRCCHHKHLFLEARSNTVTQTHAERMPLARRRT